MAIIDFFYMDWNFYRSAFFSLKVKKITVIVSKMRVPGQKNKRGTGVKHPLPQPVYG